MIYCSCNAFNRTIYRTLNISVIIYSILWVFFSLDCFWFLLFPPEHRVKQCLRRNSFLVIQSVSLVNLLLLFWPSVHWKTETLIWSRATAIKCKKKQSNKVDNNT